VEYIGLDCHKQYDHATMIDTETGEVKAKRLAHTKEEFREFIGKRANTRMVLELCWNWSKTYELAKDPVEEVILAHPLKVKAIVSAKVKTDAIDSRTLAQLLMDDLIPQAHLRKADNRVKQRVIRHRAFIVAMRTRIKNRIHDLVNNQPLPPEIVEAKPTNLFLKKRKRGTEWLTSLKWDREEDRRIVQSDLRLIERLNQEISTSNEMIEEIHGKDRGCPASFHHPRNKDTPGCSH